MGDAILSMAGTLALCGFVGLLIYARYVSLRAEEPYLLTLRDVTICIWEGLCDWRRHFWNSLWR